MRDKLGRFYMGEVEKKLLDLKQTAEALSISTRTVHRLKKRGLLKSHPSLGKLLFSTAIPQVEVKSA